MSHARRDMKKPRKNICNGEISENIKCSELRKYKNSDDKCLLLFLACALDGGIFNYDFYFLYVRSVRDKLG